MREVKLHGARVFRETPSVYFADAWIPGQNGLDVVTHHGPAVSPPYTERGEKQFYVHLHQTDYNRVLMGERIFELVFPGGGHYYVHLDDTSGALEIPPGVYHRSVSAPEGSVLINQAVRDRFYNENTEFFPRYPSSDEVLQAGYLRPAEMVGDPAKILILLAEIDNKPE